MLSDLAGVDRLQAREAGGAGWRWPAVGAAGVEDGGGNPVGKPGGPGRHGGCQLQGGRTWGPLQGGGLEGTVREGGEGAAEGEGLLLHPGVEVLDRA